MSKCSNCLIDVAEALHVHFTQALDLVVHLLHAYTDVVLDCLERSINLFGAATQLFATGLSNTVGCKIDRVLAVALRALV